MQGRVQAQMLRTGTRKRKRKGNGGVLLLLLLLQPAMARTSPLASAFPLVVG